MHLNHLLALLLTPVCAFGAFKAGVAKRVVTPDLKSAPAYIAGFDNGRAATAVHDDLWARCVAFEAGNQVVLCGVDSIGLFFDDVAKVRQLVKAKHPAAQVVVAVTHVHEAPDTMGLWGKQMGVSGINEDYNALVVSNTAAAAIEALDSLQPARIRAAQADPPSFKEFYDDSRPPFVIDSAITAIALETPKGVRIATLIHWTNHPEALGSKNTLITSDFVHYLRDEIERSGGATCVFLNGAIGGMMSPLGAAIKDFETGQPAPKDTFRFAESVGRPAARIALAALKPAKPIKADTLSYRESEVTIPVANKNYLMASAAGLFKGRKAMGGDPPVTRTPVGLFTISAKGKPAIQAAMIPGELFPELSLGRILRDPNADFPNAPLEPGIKSDILTAPIRIVVGLANDEIGYIIPKAQWDQQPPYTFGAAKQWYGEVNSVGPEAAPLIIQAVQALAQEPRR
jgi:hypothetical protein